MKSFADDTSIFSVVNDINVSAEQMTKNLEKISMWAYQWKMSFNSEITYPNRLRKLPHRMKLM